MMRYLSPILSICLILVCVGCGGGGSGSSSVKADGSWLTFNPAPVELIAYQGESTSFSIIATSNKSISTPFNVGIVEPKGIINGNVKVLHIDTLKYRADIETSSTLALGEYSSNLEVRLCEDDPLVCQKPIPGSPWFVPVKLSVKQKSEAIARLSFTPSVVDITTYEGEPTDFSVTAKLNENLPNATLSATSSAVLSDIYASQQSSNVANEQNYRVSFRTSPSLTSGDYVASLELHLCLDIQCSRQIAGSPWIVPVSVHVKSNTNLTALKVFPNLQSWSGEQGNASHDGYVPATFDPSQFSRRWSILSGSSVSRMVIDSGKIVQSNGATIFAFNEADGLLSWKWLLSSQGGSAGSSLSPNAAANGKICFISDGISNNAYFGIIDSKTGNTITKTSVAPFSNTFGGGPTLFGDDAYVSFGQSGGMAKFNVSNGQRLWNVALPYDGTWTPAVDKNNAYTYLLGDFYAISVATGNLTYKIPDTDYKSNSNVSPGASIVLSDTNIAFVRANGRVMEFDLVKREKLWSFSYASSFGSSANLSYAKSVVYLFNAKGTALEARSADKGELLWSSVPLTSYSGQLVDGSAGFYKVIVTDNLAFVSSLHTTLAIDLKTHGIVWKYPRGGELAISNQGVLYISNDGGSISAINLQ